MANIIPFLLLLLLLPLGFLAIALWGRLAWSRETAALTLKSFLWGAAAVFPLLFLRWLTAVVPGLAWDNLIQRSQLGAVVTQVVLLVVLALVLEWLKNQALLAAWFGNQPFLARLGEGVFYGAAAAIGFSLIDNASYLITDVTRFAWPDFARFTARVAGSTALYLLTTIGFGLYYLTALRSVKAKQAASPTWAQCRAGLPQAWRFHHLRKHALARVGGMVAGGAMAGQSCQCKRPPGAILAEGWVLVVLLHAVYLLGTQLG